MLRDLLNAIKFQAQPDKSLTKMQVKMNSEIDKDLASLVHHMSDEDGCIDYYSPKAKEQMDYQKAILDKYFQAFSRLKITMIASEKKTDYKTCEDQLKRVDMIHESIRKIEIRLKEIEMNREMDPTMKESLKSSFLMLIHDWQKEIAGFNHAYDSLLNKPEWLQVEKSVGLLKRRMEKHNKIVAAIPEGMLDVKRVLSIQKDAIELSRKLHQAKKEWSRVSSPGEREQLQVKVQDLETKYNNALASVNYSESEVEDKKIKSMIEDLRKIMANSIKGYRDICQAGGESNTFLHHTTAFYWESLNLYQTALSRVTQYIQGVDSLTEQGEFIKKCLENALAEAPDESLIENALEDIRAVDMNPSDREVVYESFSERHDLAMNFYKKTGQGLTRDLLSGTNDPMFFIPYNANCYTLDNPAHVDIMNALGNCYGETQMFLERINSSIEPTFNNICPETTLINYQLDQSRTTAKENFDGKLSVSLSDSSDRIKWDNIHDILLSDIASKNGELYLLKFSGASVPGHTPLVSHAMGFIKLREPNPYQYVLYDYNLGTFGFSNETQLELFFKTVLEGGPGKEYYPYSKFSMEKIGDVNDKCRDFIGGGIGPLERERLDEPFERNDWNKERLIMLAKYCTRSSKLGGVGFVLDKIRDLSDDLDKNDVYRALRENKYFDYVALVKIAMENKDQVFLDTLLNPLDDEAFSSILATIVSPGIIESADELIEILTSLPEERRAMLINALEGRLVHFMGSQPDRERVLPFISDHKKEIMRPMLQFVDALGGSESAKLFAVLMLSTDQTKVAARKATKALFSEPKPSVGFFAPSPVPIDLVLDALYPLGPDLIKKLNGLLALGLTEEDLGSRDALKASMESFLLRAGTYTHRMLPVTPGSRP